MTILELINNTEKKLTEAKIETPRLDAEVLLGHALGMDRSSLYMTAQISSADVSVARFESYIKKRMERCPVAYITGKKEFWSIDIKVTPDVMIPRPETELIVEKALELIKDKNAAIEILDLCTGSGCIAVALATELPNAKFTLVDISKKALDVARSNILFAANRSKFLCGDLFNALSDEKFDLIVSNPPYVPRTESANLARDITDHEPDIAIFGGEDGLLFETKIINNAAKFLKPQGSFIMEMGIEQSAILSKTAHAAGYKNVSIAKDLAGIDRVAIFAPLHF